MLKGTVRTGSWVRVRYTNNAGKIRIMEQFHPSLLKGSKLLDEYSARLLKENNDVDVIHDLRTI